MTQIGRYEIVRKSGTYGLTSLYDAFDPLMGRKVSIKIAEEAEGFESEPARAALMRDGKNLGALDHPNIVRVLGCEENAPTPYLVLEHFEGVSLSDALRQAGSMDAGRVAQLVAQAAAALDYAHERGMVHRNMTPESILLDETNKVKITAFDIAGSMQALEGADLTGEADVLMQSIPYLSPELLLGDAPGPASDQFSIAAIAFRCLMGKAPFGGESPVAHMFEIAFEAPSALQELESRYPAAAGKALGKALSKRPDERYGSCSDFARALESGLLRKPAGATRVVAAPASEPAAAASILPPPTPSMAPERGGSKKLAIWGAVAAAAAAIGYWALSLGSGNPKPAPAVSRTELNEQLKNAARSIAAPAPQAAAEPAPKAKPPAAKPKKKAAAKKKEPEPPPIELKFAEPKVVQK
jgi:eukaryotic-like serine/threonine-protein kinase